MDERAVQRRIQGTVVADALLAVAGVGGEAERSELSEALGVQEREVGQVVSQMRQLGLVVLEDSLAGEVELTASGNRIAVAIRTSQESGAERADAVQRGLMTWLLEEEYASGVSGFVGHPEAAAYGVLFTEEEVQEASDYLTEKDLIRSISSMGYTSGLRPEITPEGRAALRSGLPIVEYVRGGSGGASSHYDYRSSTVITGGQVGAVQTGGTRNTQNVTVTLAAEDRVQIIATVSALLRQLDDMSDAASMREALEDVKAEAAKTDSTAEKVKDKIVTAIATAAVTKGAEFVLGDLPGLLALVTGAG